MPNPKRYIARDLTNSNMWFELKTPHPRKELAELYSGKIDKMYYDTPTGETMEDGYVIGTHWLQVREIVPPKPVNFCHSKPANSQAANHSATAPDETAVKAR